MSASPRLSDRIEDAALGTALAVIRLLGPRAPAVGAGIGRLGYRPFRIRRAHVEANLRIAFPEREAAWIRRTARDAYAHLGRETVNTLLAARTPGTVPCPVAFEGLDVLEQGLAAGHGVVMLGGHLGNWELGIGALAASGFPITAVVRRQRNPLFDRRIAAVRQGFGIDLVHRGEARRDVPRALRQNRIVVLIADQDARGAGVFVPFFGRPASTPRGPAVFALRSGASLAFVSPLRDRDGGLTVRVEPLAVPEDAADPLRRITASYAETLERAVRGAPEQYLWHHRRWKTSPPEPTRVEPEPMARP